MERKPQGESTKQNYITSYCDRSKISNQAMERLLLAQSQPLWSISFSVILLIITVHCTHNSWCRAGAPRRIEKTKLPNTYITISHPHLFNFQIQTSKELNEQTSTNFNKLQVVCGILIIAIDCFMSSFATKMAGYHHFLSFFGILEVL